MTSPRDVPQDPVEQAIEKALAKATIPGLLPDPMWRGILRDLVKQVREPLKTPHADKMSRAEKAEADLASAGSREAALLEALGRKEADLTAARAEVFASEITRKALSAMLEAREVDLAAARGVIAAQAKHSRRLGDELDAASEQIEYWKADRDVAFNANATLAVERDATRDELAAARAEREKFFAQSNVLGLTAIDLLSVLAASRSREEVLLALHDKHCGLEYCPAKDCVCGGRGSEGPDPECLQHGRSREEALREALDRARACLIRSNDALESDAELDRRREAFEMNVEQFEGVGEEDYRRAEALIPRLRAALSPAAPSSEPETWFCGNEACVGHNEAAPPSEPPQHQELEVERDKYKALWELADYAAVTLREKLESARVERGGPPDRKRERG